MTLPELTREAMARFLADLRRLLDAEPDLCYKQIRAYENVHASDDLRTVYLTVWFFSPVPDPPRHFDGNPIRSEVRLHVAATEAGEVRCTAIDLHYIDFDLLKAEEGVVRWGRVHLPLNEPIPFERRDTRVVLERAEPGADLFHAVRAVLVTIMRRHGNFQERVRLLHGRP